MSALLDQIKRYGQARQDAGEPAGTFAIMGLSLYLVSVAIHHGMHVGSAYAVWTGLGAAGTAILGIILYNEPRDLMRLLCIALIIGGAVGLKAVSPPPQATPAFWTAPLRMFLRWPRVATPLSMISCRTTLRGST